MKWWLHFTLYVACIFGIFFLVGGLIAVKYPDLAFLAIFLIPLPIAVFHVLWKNVKVACTKDGCDGTMRMSSAGSLYYTCSTCGHIRTTIVKVHPNR